MKYRGTAIFLFLLAVCFTGITTGIIIAKNKQADVSELESYISEIKSTELSIKTVFVKGLLTNLPLFIILNMLGMLVFGFPISTLLLFYKGYAVGFSCGCICLAMGLKGIGAALAGILLPSFILFTLLCHMVYSFWNGEDKSIIKAERRYRSRILNGIAYFLLFCLCVFSQSIIQYVVFYKFL